MSTSKKTVVADRLREAIDRGDYRPGQRLPGEEELAELFHVSRATARLGVRTLQKEGRVDIRAGRGVYVANHRPVAHLAGPVSGATDSERFRAGYEPHLRKAGYHQVEEEIKVSLGTMRSGWPNACVATRRKESPRADSSSSVRATGSSRVASGSPR